MTQEDTDLQKIKKLIEIMKENDLVEVEIKHGDDKILLKRCSGANQVGAGPIIEPSISTAKAQLLKREVESNEQTKNEIQETKEDLVEIKSPIVGTFYAAPSSDSDPFVKPGSQVSPQTVVCIIEAMKVMNEIKAEISGTIAEIHLKNGQAVEYGQVLFKVKPD